MTGTEGLSRSAILYLTQQAQATNPLQASHSLSASEGTKNANGSSPLDQSSASISGLGQLFSNLQQLQNQDPSQFTQVIAQVVSLLLNEAQQQTNDASQYLTNLANSFQQAAVSGSLPMPYAPSATEMQPYSSSTQTTSTLQDFYTTQTKHTQHTSGA